MPLALSRFVGQRARKTPSDLVGIDVATTGIKAVRFRRINGDLTVLAADILPLPEAAAEGPIQLDLPKRLRSNYAALAFSTPRDAVRLMNLPGRLDDGPNLEMQVREFMKTEGRQRLNYRIMGSEPGKAETRVLAVSSPEADAQSVLQLVATGAPAPHSLEVSGLAALTAFLHGPGREQSEEAVCMIESGARMTLITFVNRGIPVLVRKLDWGGAAWVERVGTQLGLDQATVLGTLAEGSLDVSSSVADLLDPFLKQLSISRDFVERQEKCRVRSVFVSGGTSRIRHWLNEIRSAMDIDVQVVNPFRGLILAPDAYPPALEGQEVRFAAAVGAVLGAMDPA